VCVNEVVRIKNETVFLISFLFFKTTPSRSIRKYGFRVKL
jgi:hypothetical protein